MSINRLISVKSENGTLRLALGSGWRQPGLVEQVVQVIDEIKRSKDHSQLVFKDEGLDRDDALVSGLLLEIVEEGKARDMDIDLNDLPEKIKKLLELSLVVPRQDTKEDSRESIVVSLGKYMSKGWEHFNDFMEFLGELIVALGRLIRGKARFQRRDLWLTMQQTGVEALPIVSIISILIGMILAFVGGLQLEKFGAAIYVVDLVGIAMAREMGCIMTGIIMSGRTGAAFAAQIGSMNVNEEVDALETLTLSPMEFLVLPRMLAMIMMMPLLTIYSDLLGCFGGAIVALSLDITPAQYINQLLAALDLRHVSIGIGKSFLFGIIVASAGCFYGLRSGRSSAAVGQAATSAVVTGITWIIVFDAFAAVLLQIFDL